MTQTLIPPAVTPPGTDATRRGPRVYDLSAFRPTVRPTDVFVCTYPKSGTTWLGYLLANALKPDPAEPLDLKSFGKYVPDVNLQYTKRGSLAEHAGLPDPRFFLCHAAYNAALATTFPKVVYVLRDPRDAMLSYWHYQRFLAAGYDKSLADFLREGEHWPCDWDEHVTGWLLPRRHPNLLVLRYEDLHADAAGALRAVLALAGVDRTDAQIAAAVEASRFDKMRAAEDKGGVHGKAGGSAERFVRKGRVGSWRDEMTPADLRVLEDRYGDVMRQVGYETEL
jgi:estrone sulfotransferase